MWKNKKEARIGPHIFLCKKLKLQKPVKRAFKVSHSLWPRRRWWWWSEFTLQLDATNLSLSIKKKYSMTRDREKTKWVSERGRQRDRNWKRTIQTQSVIWTLPNTLIPHFQEIVGSNPSTRFWMDICAHYVVIINFNVCWERPKINEKEAGDEPLKTRKAEREESIEISVWGCKMLNFRATFVAHFFNR